MDSEVIRYLHSKQIMAMFTQGWKTYYGKGRVQSPPWEHIEVEVKLVVNYLYVSVSPGGGGGFKVYGRVDVELILLQASSQMSSDVLFRDFKEADGYKLLVNMLIEGSASPKGDEKQV